MSFAELPAGLRACLVKNMAHSCAATSMRIAAGCYRREAVTGTCQMAHDLAALGTAGQAMGGALNACKTACDEAVRRVAGKDIAALRAALAARQVARDRLFGMLDDAAR